MKLKGLNILCMALLMSVQAAVAQSAAVPAGYTKIAYPAPQTKPAAFSINAVNQVFLPLNGGIYLPKDSLWFIPPSRDYYFTSFAPSLKDTALFVFANTATESDLFYLKSSLKSPIKRSLILKLEKGLYNLDYKNDICYVWGYVSGASKIGILVKNEVKWLLNIRGLIKQVQVDDANNIFFLYNNAIYQLNNHRLILSDKKTLYGFAFDKNNHLVICREDGIGVKTGSTLNIIATGVKGTLACNNQNLFVLDRANNNIIQFKYQ